MFRDVQAKKRQGETSQDRNHNRDSLCAIKNHSIVRLRCWRCKAKKVLKLWKHQTPRTNFPYFIESQKTHEFAWLVSPRKLKIINSVVTASRTVRVKTIRKTAKRFQLFIACVNYVVRGFAININTINKVTANATSTINSAGSKTFATN